MESVVFFEKKLNLTPQEFNEIKIISIDDMLLKKARDTMENKCSENGFILPGSIRLHSRSMGYFEAARFTGDAIYYVKLEGKAIYPVDGIRVTGEVIRKNKMGLYVNYQNAIRIQVPRDLHLGNEIFDNVMAVAENLEERVKKIITEQLAVDASEVTPKAQFVQDLGADSLDTVELVMALEEEFDIEIPDEDAEKIKTVGEAVTYIKDKAGKGN